MVSSVRAVALQALAERNRVSLADLQRYEKYAPQMDLFGLAAYLDAAVKVKGADDLAHSLAERNRVSLADLQRYEKYAPQMDLFGLAAYLDAAVKVKGADDLAHSLAQR